MTRALRWLGMLVCCGALAGSTVSCGAQDAATAAPDAAAADSAAEDEAPAEESDKAEAVDHEPITVIDPRVPVDQLAILVKPLTLEELEIEAEAWFDLLRKKAGEIAAVQLAIKKITEATGSPDQPVEAALREAEAVVRRAEQEVAQSVEQATARAQEGLGLPAQPSSDAAEDADEEAGAGNAASADTTSADDAQPQAAAKREELLDRLTELQDERTSLADRLEVVLLSLEAKGGEVTKYREYMAAVSGIQVDTTDFGAAWAAITGWLTSREGGQRWAWNVAQFLLILLVTLIVGKLIEKIVYWLLERRVQLSQLAEKLIARTIKNVILLVGLAVALTALEIDITPIIAAIGAAGFIIGFAVQGTLSNFASGLMILVNRPFDVGDVVTAGGITGVIHEMNLVSTTFRTFDNQTIHVPNNSIWGSVITNITANDTRRVDLEFGIGYDDDFERAEQIMREVVTSHELVLDDPPPEVVTHLLGDSSVQIVCRPWAKTNDWWTVKTDLTRQIKKRFDEEGISIPYPQRDVHIYQHNGRASENAAESDRPSASSA